MINQDETDALQIIADRNNELQKHLDKTQRSFQAMVKLLEEKYKAKFDPSTGKFEENA